MLFGVLLDMGTQSFITRRVARRPEAVGGDFWFFMLFRLGLIGAYAAMVLLGGRLLGYEGRAWHLLVWITLGQALLSLVMLFRSILNGLHIFRWEAVLSVTDRLLMIVGVGIPLLGIGGWELTIERFVKVQVGAYGLTLLTAVWLLRPYLQWERRWWSWRFFRAILAQSMPYALLMFLMTLYTRTDSVMLERLHPNGAAESGIYAAAYRLLDAAVMVPALIASRLLPMFSRHLQQRRPLLPLIHIALPVIIGWGWLVTLSAAFWGPFLMKALYWEVAPHQVAVFRWLMPTLLFHGLVYIYGALLTAAGRMRTLNLISALGFVGNIALNLWAIPRYGALGAVVATLITQGAVSLVQTGIAVQRYDLYLSKRFLGLFGGWLLGGTAVFYLVSRFAAGGWEGFIACWGAAAIFAWPFARKLWRSRLLST